ncbi:MAG: cupin domain-containing protein [Chloroflexota bacterium]
MHVAPAGFRAIRNGGVTLRFAVLRDIAAVLAELPETGSAGTIVEELCERPHWAFVARGSIVVTADTGRWEIAAGTAFHVPPDLPHRFHASGRAELVGFERLGPDDEITDERLAEHGFEIVRGAGTASRGVLPVPAPRAPADDGEIASQAVAMGDLLLAQTRFGARSGYTSLFCDLEHWGIVTAGSLVIEWERDIEILSAGDVFYCPPGPPGHRFHAADPAASIDFTPLAGFDRPGRVVDWRRVVAAGIPSRRRPRRPAEVETAALG